MSLNLAHQNSYPEFVNHMSNETLIRQKYESMSQSDYSNHQPHHNDNVEDYLNFGSSGYSMLENYENIHGVKQEDLDCDFLQGHDHKHQMENGMGYEQNHLPFIQHAQNGGVIGDASYFLYKQQTLPQVNSAAAINPTTGAGQSAPIQFDNSQLSAKMKRIMKREKAKSRRKMTLEQQQQQQQVASNTDSSFKPTISAATASVPVIAQQSNEDPASFYKQSVEFSGQQEKLEMRSCSTSCSSNSAQFEVKIEPSSSGASSQTSANNGSINPAHLLEQKLKKSTSTLNHEELQLKALSQCSGNMDNKQQKKVMQMIRNRISAQNSRDRKKAYISKLESDKEDFLNVGQELKQTLIDAQEEVIAEKSKNELLQKEIQELKKKLQSQCKCFNTNPEKIQQAQMNPTPVYSKYNNHNSLQKHYAAFSVAFFAVLGVVLIFNVKPSKNEQAIINQSSQMMKMLDDLQKSTQDFQNAMRNEKDEIGVVDAASILRNKSYVKDILKEELSGSCEDDMHHHMEQEEQEIPQTIEQTSPFNLNMLSKNSGEQIQKDQWIQFFVPKGDQSQRDDLSRDSAETDVSHNASQKYMQVWAQIKSVEEFESSN